MLARFHNHFSKNQNDETMIVGVTKDTSDILTRIVLI